MTNRKDRVLNALARSENRGSRGLLKDRPKRRRSKPRASDGHLYEHQEQALVCDWLDSVGAVYFATMNGSHLAGDKDQRARQIAKLRRMGMRAGVPDLIIVTPPPCGGYVGVALEMKRGGPNSNRPTKEQWEWLDTMRQHGWAGLVAHGADDAITQLEALGYGKPDNPVRTRT